MKANLKGLSVEVMDEILNTLKYFPRVHISRKGGKYVVSTGVGLSDKYSDNDTYLGYVDNTDIYSVEVIDMYIKLM